MERSESYCKVSGGWLNERGWWGMKYIIRFENGAEQEIPAALCYTPSFSMKVREGIRFHFRWADELPSGDQLYVETSEEDADRIWKESGTGS